MGATAIIAGIGALTATGSAIASRQNSIQATDATNNAAAQQEQQITLQNNILKQTQVQDQLVATRNAQYLQVRRQAAAQAGAVGVGSTYATGVSGPPAGGKTLIGQ